jgi:hypothetical protein
MTMRYQAPQHTGAVYAPSRPYYADENGVIEVPDDAPEGDHAALRSVGCAAIVDEAPKAKSAKAPDPVIEVPAATTEQQEDDLKA